MTYVYRAILALFLCVIICYSPNTITAKVVGVEYHQDTTDLFAELPDGNVEWWTLNYIERNIPVEIEIYANSHEIYKFRKEN